VRHTGVGTCRRVTRPFVFLGDAEEDQVHLAEDKVFGESDVGHHIGGDHQDSGQGQMVVSDDGECCD